MSKKYSTIGIDEVGRGSLAGPILVTALFLPKKTSLKNKNLPRLKDSKRLSALQREKWFKYIKSHPKIVFVTSRVLPQVIDRINITEAANRAATKAFLKLAKSKKQIGNRTNIFLDGGLYLNSKTLLTNGHALKPKTIIKGDEKINAIKLASIVAKVTRDRYMVRLHKKHPKYFLNEHKGYGTKKHFKAIRKHGPSNIHRLTFI